MSMSEIPFKLIRHTPHQPPIDSLSLRDFDFNNPMYEPIALSNQMQMFCHDNQYVAITAPQLDIRLNVIYMIGRESACFNPKLVDHGEEVISFEETLVGIDRPFAVKIKRPEIIKVRFADAFGEVHTEIFSGLTSRVFQRKLDVLNKVSLKSRTNQYHWDKAMKEYNDKI